MGTILSIIIWILGFVVYFTLCYNVFMGMLDATAKQGLCGILLMCLGLVGVTFIMRELTNNLK